MIRMVWIAVLLLAPGAVVAQEVYKCKDASGALTFSQQPCGESAETVVIKTHQPSASDRAYASGRLRPSAVGLDGDMRVCFERAKRSVYSSTGREIDNNNSRIAQLERRLRLVNNNLAGATLEAGLRQEVAALHQANATLRSTGDEMLRDAEDGCRRERDRREAAALEAEQREFERLEAERQNAPPAD